MNTLIQAQQTFLITFFFFYQEKQGINFFPANRVALIPYVNKLI